MFRTGKSGEYTLKHRRSNMVRLQGAFHTDGVGVAARRRKSVGFRIECGALASLAKKPMLLLPDQYLHLITGTTRVNTRIIEREGDSIAVTADRAHARTWTEKYHITGDSIVTRPAHHLA